MLTAAETRRARLERLIAAHNGRIADLNEALGYERTSSKLARIRNANARTDREDKTFQMGDALAREIEDKLKLERGWMDTPIGYELINDERVAHVLGVMELMPRYKLDQAVRVIDALAQPDQ